MSVEQSKKERQPKQHKDEDKEKKPRSDPHFIQMQADQAKVQQEIVKLYDQLKQNGAELKALYPENKDKYIPATEKERAERSEQLNAMKKINEEIKKLNEIIGDKSDHPKLKFKSVEDLADEIYRLEYDLEHNNHTVAEEKEFKKQIAALDKLKFELPALLVKQAERQVAFEARSKLFEQLKPMKEKENQFFKMKNEQIKAREEVKVEKDKLDEIIAEKKKQGDAISVKIDELKKEKDNIFKRFQEESDKRQQEYEKKREENQKRFEASKAARTIVDSLKEAGVRVYEKGEKFSGDFEVSIPKLDYDPQAPSKNGLIGWLKAEIEKPEPKVEEKKELTKQEQKKMRQQKKIVMLDLTVDAWLDDLRIKQADIETLDQKKAVLLKLQTGVNEEIQKENDERMTKINALIEQLKKCANVTIVEFKPHVEQEDRNKKDFQKK